MESNSYVWFSFWALRFVWLVFPVSECSLIFECFYITNEKHGYPVSSQENGPAISRNRQGLRPASHLGKQICSQDCRMYVLQAGLL